MDRPYFSAESILIEMFGSTLGVSEAKASHGCANHSDADFVDVVRNAHPANFDDAIARLGIKGSGIGLDMPRHTGAAFTAHEVLIEMFGDKVQDHRNADRRGNITDVEYVEWNIKVRPRVYSDAMARLTEMLLLG